ncbi:MAG TPA: calcium-binding protein [Actinomycetota bacterium]|nr:calcium-binding protein [Actinomycetota bacterium]
MAPRRTRPTHTSHRWSRPSSILRVLVSTTLTLLLVFGVLAAPLASAAVACSFDAGTGVVTITFADGDDVTIERSGDDIVVNGATCTGATVTTTDTIWILESGPGGEDLASLTIDMSGGPFAPGKTDEGDGSSEIEFLTGDQQDVDGDRMTLGSVTIVGTPGNDTILVGVIDEGGYSPIDLNGDEETLDWDIPGFGVDGADLDTPPAVDGGAGDDDLRAGGHSPGAAGSSLVLRGGPGDDTLMGGDLHDEIDGGPGTDTIATVVEAWIDLAAGVATTKGGGGGSDAVSGVENILGSEGRDFLTGDDGPNRIDGAGGNWDVIAGGGGDDHLIGGDGTIDTADFSAATNGVDVDVVQGTATGEGNDTIEGIEWVLGSPYDDHVISAPWVYWVHAGDGDDVVRPVAPNVVYGEGGIDTLDLSAATGSVSAVLSTGDLRIDGQSAGAEDFENAIGSRFADDIIGTPDPNRIQSGHGADVVYGSGGEDVLLGKRGADTLDGADGRDEVYGGRGNDRVSGGRGIDTCIGGPGEDTLDLCEILKRPAA